MEDAMIGWGQIGYGALLSGILAAVAVALAARPHRLVAAIGGGAATIAGAGGVERNPARHTRRSVLHRRPRRGAPGELARHRLRRVRPSRGQPPPQPRRPTVRCSPPSRRLRRHLWAGGIPRRRLPLLTSKLPK